VILKGSSVLPRRTGRVWVNTTGGPALAKGRFRDVLTGVLAALTDNSGTSDWLRVLALALIFTVKRRKHASVWPMLQDNCRAASPLPFPWRATDFFRRFASVSEEIVTHSAEETIAWGREFASRVKAPLMILLSGDLGQRQTTLTKGNRQRLGAAARRRRHKSTSLSFTFTAPKTPNKSLPRRSLSHRKFHVSKRSAWKDIFAKPAIVILEWSERFPLPSPWPQIRIPPRHAGGDARRSS